VLRVKPHRSVIKEGPADQAPVSRTDTIVLLIQYIFCILTLSEHNNMIVDETMPHNCITGKFEKGAQKFTTKIAIHLVNQNRGVHPNKYGNSTSHFMGQGRV